MLKGGSPAGCQSRSQCEPLIAERNVTHPRIRPPAPPAKREPAHHIPIREIARYNVRMRVVNRTAVTVVGSQPYVEWTRSRDAEFNSGQLTVARSKSFGSAFLLPEVDYEEDLQEWVEENFAWIFEFQLSTWTSDESAWPQDRDLAMFRKWFTIDLHNVVVDVADDDIEGEEL